MKMNFCLFQHCTRHVFQISGETGPSPVSTAPQLNKNIIIIESRKTLLYLRILHLNISSLKYLSQIFLNFEAADIMLLMRSKYGIIITPEVAKDIALNVAGGKLVEEKQYESANRTLLNSAMAKLVSKTEADKIPSEDTEAESDVYFDIVQLAALLLTPNILEFSKNEDTEVFERVLSQLLEPLYDVDEEKLRSTGILDIDLLRKILVAAGDFDTANNQALMEQMIQLASNKGNFDISSFQHALTSDVAEGFNDVAVSKTSNTRATSTFFDVFGCNWEDSREEHKSEKYEKVSTWSHVDYASDSYHSYILNIIIWIQFMFGSK